MGDAVIVTGAAGALGGAVVAVFREQGRPVVALDRAGERLDEAGSADGVHPVAVDLGSREAVQAAFAEVDARPVRPGALVTLAGGF
ncbi:MAG TPA: SDR family NAD(P)-dependent oxidoreductase, partial [Pseudonocardia sp.]|nr:SDR family NAD(P)-dependent oxidoreductase [Pseudonocardia sp.]